MPRSTIIIKPSNYQIIKFLIGVFLSVGTVSAQNPALVAGDPAPPFSGKNIDQHLISFTSYPRAKGFIVIFISNTCPYSKAYLQRIIDLNKKYAPLNFPLIAINSNDPQLSRKDRISEMKNIATTHHFSFPYLSDEHQLIADLYGAKATPQVFVISKKDSGYTVEYIGAIDNDAKQQRKDRVNYTANAVEALLQDKKPAIPGTHSIGCTITRKRK